MLKRFLFAAVAALFMAIQFNIGSVNAVEVDKSIRTVKLNDQGEEVVLSLKQVKQGQKYLLTLALIVTKVVEPRLTLTLT